jgi:hypothetical protein
MSVYTVRAFEHGWRVTKFDSDLNVESSYAMLDEPKGVACECPQAARGHCRHIDILGMFQAEGRVNSGWFLDLDSGEWVPPIESGEPPPAPVPDEERKPKKLAPSSGFHFEGVERIRRI